MDPESKRMLDDLPVGVYLARVPDGEIAHANRAFCDLVGAGSLQECRIGGGLASYRVSDREGRPFPVERLPMSRVLATGMKAVVDEMVICRADGKNVHVRATGHPVRDAAGQLTHVMITFIDNTREVEAEVARDALAERLRYTVEHAPIVLFCVDRDGIATLSEGAGLKALGLRPGDHVGMSVFEIYKDHPTVPTIVRRALAGESVSASVRLGESVMDVRLTPMRDAAGVVTGALGVSHDRSELSRLEAAAIQSDRIMAMGTLAASVAHEINNPLTYILSHLADASAILDEQRRRLADLARSLPGSKALSAAAEQAHTALEPVRKGVERIASITRDLRSFSRPDERRFEPVDLRRVVESVLRLIRKEAEARATVRLALEDTPLVMGNEARLVQVVTNLLMNAVQALALGRPGRDEIRVATRVDGGKVILEVSDSGPGVPARDRERVFEPFVTTKPIGEGTGLGLFVCRNIIRALGGTIEVCDGPRGGALLRTVLPVAPHEAAVAPCPWGEPGQRVRDVRVLVIDDDAAAGAALAAQLAAAGFSADRTEDAVEALERLTAGEPFDLVYCDIMMPGMTGVDFATALEGRAPERLSRVVFMTGGVFTGQAAAFVAARRDRCVEKPFDVVGETLRRLADCR
jgi:signal transduction histidine kinase